MKNSIGEKLANMFTTIGLSLNPFGSAENYISNNHRTSNFRDSQKKDADEIARVWAEVGEDFNKVMKK